MLAGLEIIDDVIVNGDVRKSKFACNLKACKGACCTMESEYGAPITKYEIETIMSEFDIIKEYLPATNLKKIQKDGFYENKGGEILIKSVDNKDCVFSYYENDVAKCGIEKAFNDKKIDFQKPISCHLFPIRVTDFGGAVLRYERYEQCLPAIENGEDQNVTVAEFCKDPLIRAYGKEWYEKFMNYEGDK